jgi:putative peptide zinc metalloprotease protein
MGIMLLVFFPVPYVDASSASAFVNKQPRMLVGAAGMLAEMFIAAIAFYLWIMLEPGFIRSLAYNTIVLASITTLLFNANPLLRYDGYYVLADWAEIPNLATRSNRYWQYLAERYLFGVRQSEPPDSTVGERRWFIGYAPLAFAYRMFVLFGIALFVAQQYFFLGVLLAVWGIVMSIGVPMTKAFAALATGPQFAARTGRVRMVLVGVAGALGLLLFVLPMPHHTDARGVVWLPEQAILRAGASGFVAEILAEPGVTLEPGDPVAVSREPTLVAQIAGQKAKVDEASVRYDAVRSTHPVQAGQLEEALRREQAGLDRLQEEAAQLTLRAQAGGVLLMEQPADLPGRFVRKGEVLGYVVGEYAPLVRVVVTQSDIELVRQSTVDTAVRFPQSVAETWSARVIREVPKAGNELPSPALGQAGGGDIALDPSDEQRLTRARVGVRVRAGVAGGRSGRVHRQSCVRALRASVGTGGSAHRARLRRLFLSYFNV